MEESSVQLVAEAPREASTSTETPRNGTSAIQGDVEIGTHLQATLIDASGDGESNDIHDQGGNVDVKAENGVRANGVSQGQGGAEGIGKVSQKVLQPLTNGKESESEATDATASQGADGLKSKKRKRAVSPPWQFPTAEATTIKTADGRRASARHNGTPTVGSESEGQARSDSRPTSQSRPPSPPWKKFAVEGPTAVRVDGKRLSTRVNKVATDPEPAKPQRVSPRSKKVVDKVEEVKKSMPAPKLKPQQASITKAAVPQKATRHVVPKREDTADAASPKRTIKELTAQIAAIKYNRSFDAEADNEAQTPQKHKRKRSDGNRNTPGRSLSPTQTRTVEKSASRTLSPDARRSGLKLRLRLAPPTYAPVHPPHPHAMLPSPQRPPRPSLYQVIESYELKEMQQPYMENERGPPDRKEFALRAWKAAESEALQRRKILRAAAPNMPLSVQACSVYRDDQVEVPQPFARRDHLSAHAMFLRQLQVKEKIAHRAQAKKIAYEAVEAWKVRNGPTEEDLVAEADRTFRLIAKQIVVDMRAKWEMVHQYVLERRKQEHEAELETKRQERLERQLAWSEKMVRRQRGDAGSDGSDMEEYPDSNTEDEGSGEEDQEDDDDEEDEEENMSESDNEAGSEKGDEANEEEGEVEGDALAAYLAQRKVEEVETEDVVMADASAGAEQDTSMHDQEDDPVGAQLDIAVEDDNIPPTDHGAAPASRATSTEPIISTRRKRGTNITDATDDADNPELLDDDESTDMDSEDYDSDEDMDDSDDAMDDESNTADSEDEGGNMSSLLFQMLPPVEKSSVDAALPTPMASADERNAEDDQLEDMREPSVAAEDVHLTKSAPAVRNPEAATESLREGSEPTPATPAETVSDTQATIKRVDVLSAADATELQSVPGTPVSLVRSDGAAKQLIAQPDLLHGELRSYQHAGLDWLASLYKNYTNGILADEMGLGKTIQTIALLAHLAEKLEVWEPHLVVVPTSVVLNWVTEFNKFLPGFRVLAYYGSTEERIRKRSGWANDPHHEDKSKRGYNVVVTSYQIAVKDINAIRNVTWHYLILDEAHNIRNFQTAMYQNLVRLKTSARLLLTGTPLQNSLGELWALLTFLTAGQQQRINPNALNEATSVGELEEFLNHWREPVIEIFDRGVSALSKGASDIIAQLHTQLRPFMLRRLKSDVEKDLPKKTEHTVVCKLSKRQRQLYQDYMGLADTKAQLARGNAVTAGRVLLSLRRVCNHPDLFDPRPIETSFAMEESVGNSFSAKEAVVRKLLGLREDAPRSLMIVRNEQLSKYCTKRSRQLTATKKLQQEAKESESALGDSKHDLSTLAGCRAFQRYQQRERVLHQLRDAIRVSEATVAKQPVYGSDLRERLTVRATRASAYCSVLGRLAITTPSKDLKTASTELAASERPFDILQSQSTTLQRSLPSLLTRSEALQSTLTRFAFVTPKATAPVLDLTIPPQTQSLIRNDPNYGFDSDFAHEARIRTTIAFPDSRLLVYDSGKLQRLVHLLRDLQARGSRSLIFSQMTLTLDILERFLNLLNLPYLRLDGSTPVERRQLYSAEFNKPDSKYQVMILSSRAGGVGLNLTGASSVIFYDLDWNPQMDKQCMDRAHRIGQVRDVEVYKMVSEKTVEENILRRANQKSLLDQTVIQEGNFTTDYDLSSAKQNESDEVGAAIDRLFEGGEKAGVSAIEAIEDKEDVVAAQAARKEEQVEADEFAESGKSGEKTGEATGQGSMKGHVDGWMVGWMEALMRDGVVQGPVVSAAAKRDRHGRDAGHRAKRKR
ncbi:hypothetical protein B0A48_17347 [Cryoendolithus antarcticus]|uniref:DNA helicase n=1 Tax=Cryoendolithus antarcticus TaxID=1507870 RepID=A0A1V8SCN4_9PEZI|nr:hypothetical protein B0A48_17347 [Cryoendolithus antarcticus]